MCVCVCVYLQFQTSYGTLDIFRKWFSMYFAFNFTTSGALLSESVDVVEELAEVDRFESSVFIS